MAIRRSLAEFNPALVETLQRELTRATEAAAGDPAIAALALAATLEDNSEAVAGSSRATSSTVRRCWTTTATRM